MKIKQFLSCLALSIMSCANALAQQGELAPSHRQAIAEMLDAVRQPEVVLVQVKSTGEKAGELQQLFTYIGANVRKEEIAQVLVPAYADHVSEKTARMIALGYQTPDGRVVAAAGLASARAKYGAAPAYKPSAAEAKAIRRFIASTAWREYDALYQRTAQASAGALEVYFGSYHDVLMRKAIAQLDAHYAVFDEHQEREPVKFAAPVHGIDFMDQWIALLNEDNFSHARMEWREATVMNAAGFDTWLSPDSLAAPEVVRRNLATLDTLDIETNRYLADRKNAIDQFAAAARKIARPSDLSKNFERDLAQRYEQNAAYTKSVLQSMQTTRQFLDFARSREGKLKVRNGNLVVGSMDDLVLYNKHVAQFAADNEALKQYAEAQKRRRASPPHAP